MIFDPTYAALRKHFCAVDVMAAGVISVLLICAVGVEVFFDNIWLVSIFWFPFFLYSCYMVWACERYFNLALGSMLAALLNLLALFMVFIYFFLDEHFSPTQRAAIICTLLLFCSFCVLHALFMPGGRHRIFILKGRVEVALPTRNDDLRFAPVILGVGIGANTLYVNVYGYPENFEVWAAAATALAMVALMVYVVKMIRTLHVVKKQEKKLGHPLLVMELEALRQARQASWGGMCYRAVRRLFK